MEKETRRRAARRHELLQVSLDDRKGLDRRAMERRAERDRRMKAAKVMDERRTGTDKRDVK